MDAGITGPLGKHNEVYEQLGDREPTTAIEAQAVIENIRTEKGYLSAEILRDMDKLESQSRETLLKIVKQKRETEAAYTTNISEQLYSSKYRFLYELVQNADDSLYQNLPKDSVSPFLRFEVTPDTLVVETNEDGFKRANIDAICATGRSSKKAIQSDDYIGEKGFGFKSVFSVAEEVYIQSGLWSFYFIHHRGNDGLGMVTPLDAAPDALPEGVTTRITLRYSNEAKQEYARLVEAVEELPNTTILFLQRLRNIHINVTGIDGRCKKRTYSKRYSESPLQCNITQSQGAGETETKEVCSYLLFRDKKTDMPPHERRQGRSTAKIELAFPIDPVNRQPKLSELGQHVFAYLPLLRLSQLQFLIQSDFVTSASRESVIDCPWNRALFNSIAEMFVSAVSKTFAQPDHPLRYSWLDYLPGRTMEHPWKSLYPSIKNSLQKKAIVQTRGQRQFKMASQVRILIPSCLYRGQPIIPDLSDEIYLASEYTASHTVRLKELGLQVVSWDDIIDRIQADTATLFSRIKTTDPTDPWHEAFAKMLLPAFATSSQGMTRTQERIKKLPLIPLTSPNQWTGFPTGVFGASVKVFFAFTGMTPIPESTSLRLLDRTASQNAIRKEFYQALGVEYCPRTTVFAKIKETHQESLSAIGAIDHLRYLYYQRYDQDNIRSWIQVPLTNGKTVRASSCDLYFPSHGEFDMYHLLPLQARLSFLSEELFQAEASTVRVNDEDWKTWLARTTKARYHPCFMAAPDSMGRYSLSLALQAILAHNSTFFLGTLRAHWAMYQRDAHLVNENIRQCSVSCTSGVQVPLHKTYLPTLEILAELSRLGVAQDKISVLVLPEGTLDAASYRSWKFLEDFGAVSKPNLAFYIETIETKALESDVVDLDGVAEVYQCMARLATIQDYDKLRECFDKDASPLIWDSHEHRWVARSECISDGPAFISFKTVLTRTYSRNALLNNFFSTILNIPSLTIEDVFREMELRRDSSRTRADFSLLRDIYGFLASKANRDEDWRTIKTAFTEKKMVLGESDTWHTLSTCLWRSPFALGGYQDLSTMYGGLEDFFVRRLKVKKASPSMLINEIKRMAEEALPRIDEIRTRLVEVGMMLANSTIDDSISKALNNLKDVKFLPKKVGESTTVLVKVSEEFAIPDHQRYSDALADHNVLLDLQVHEVQTLHAVFMHLGLTDRYLSSAVKEVSTVGVNSDDDEPLSLQLQAKAYALYCCAAKYKSSKALRNDSELFDQLEGSWIYTTDEITTKLILSINTKTFTVESDRSFIHHEFTADYLDIYVPADLKQRRACYRSQLPELLRDLLGVGPAATFNISSIVTSDLEDLEDILIEQDIPPVEWIQKPVLVIPDPVGNETLSTSASNVDGSNSVTLMTPRSEIVTPQGSPTQQSRREVSVTSDVEATPPEQYPEFIEQVVRSAQRAGYRHRDAQVPVANAPPDDNEERSFNHLETFGRRDENAFVHDRRIGAAGEAFVYEILSALDLPEFTLANWRSTIRGELASSTHYANMANWVGRETADIVYTDKTGALTRYLRQNSEGSFPHEIPEHWNFASHPIEYYLEVKSTTGHCSSRFYMSNGQYKRMESMALGAFQQPCKVYVIMRVFDLTTPNVGMKIFVDPIRFKGSKLDFEADQWFVTTT